jgi:hypothetical protein
MGFLRPSKEIKERIKAEKKSTRASPKIRIRVRGVGTVVTSDPRFAARKKREMEQEAADRKRGRREGQKARAAKARRDAAARAAGKKPPTAKSRFDPRKRS